MSVTDLLDRFGPDVGRESNLYKIARRLRHNRLGQLGLVFTSGFFVLVVLGLAVVSPESASTQHYSHILEGPSTQYPLGTDRYGRDVLARVLVGAKLSLFVSSAVVVISTVVGVPLGLLAGFYRGKVDEGIMRLLDILFAFPPVILGLVIVATLGPGLDKVILALGIAFTPIMARMTRGSALDIREEEYIMAAMAYGESDRGVMLRDMLPNVAPVVIIQATVVFASSIIAEAGLSYLGLSAQPPTPTWGNVIDGGQGVITTAPWIVFAPGLALFITVLGLTLLGVALRDALDPNTDVQMEGF